MIKKITFQSDSSVYVDGDLYHFAEDEEVAVGGFVDEKIAQGWIKEGLCTDKTKDRPLGVNKSMKDRGVSVK